MEQFIPGKVEELRKQILKDPEKAKKKEFTEDFLRGDLYEKFKCI
jgi:hypothetical protein